jgi:hypothetical protein
MKNQLPNKKRLSFTEKIPSNEFNKTYPIYGKATK